MEAEEIVGKNRKGRLNKWKKENVKANAKKNDNNG